MLSVDGAWDNPHPFQTVGEDASLAVPNQLLGAVIGLKFNDVDGDGTLSPEDVLMPAVEFTLMDAAGNVVSATSNDDGVFRFEDLAPGAYRLTELPLAHDVGAAPVEVDLVLGSGEVLTAVPGAYSLRSGQSEVEANPLLVPNRLSGGLVGFKFNDQDGDGQRGPSEPPLSGVTFELIANGIAVDATQTDDSGRFAFVDVPPGDYVLRETPPAGAIIDVVEWNVTISSGEFVVASGAEADGLLRSGQFIREDDAFHIPNQLEGAILGVKFHDANQDGLRNAGESGLPGVTLQLTRLENDVEGDAIVVQSDASGEFRFDGLAPGRYRLTETPPEHAFGSAQPVDLVLSGGQWLVASSELANGVGDHVVVTVEAALNVANVLTTSLHGYVFEDVNGNGVDDNEPRLPGITVLVEGDADGDGDSDEQTLTTDINGEFHLARLAPGDFVVRHQLADGLVATTALAVDLSLESGREAEAIPDLAPLATGQVAVLVPALAFGARREDPPDPPGEVAGVVQFVTPLHVFRNAGPIEPTPSPEVVAGRAAIRGFRWNDIDQDGVWDATEPARPGWVIELVADGQVIASTATDASGRYAFVDLDPGEYTVRESALVNDGPIQVTTFPSFPSTTYALDLAAGEVISGSLLTAEAPNFGGYEFSPFVRPADDLLGHVDVNADGAVDAAEFGANRDLLTALATRQSLTITNDSDTVWTVGGPQFGVAAIEGVNAEEFLTLLRYASDDRLEPLSLPVELGPGESLRLLAFYDPAVRVDEGTRVVAQFPDWLDDPDTSEDESSRPPHTFVDSDSMVFPVDGGPDHRFRLVGASTFDSDVSYNGRVDNDDLVLIVTVLAGAASVDDADNRFDLTSDVNARCPNGADGSLDTCVWAVPGGPGASPPREIGHGDIGPINVEFGRSRGGLLDLDATEPGDGVLRTLLFAASSSGVALTEGLVAIRGVDPDDRIGVAIGVVGGDAMLACEATEESEDPCRNAATVDGLSLEALSAAAAASVLQRIRVIPEGPGDVTVRVEISDAEAIDAALAEWTFL